MIGGLTELQATTAQELRDIGFLSFRIAELLDVEERLILGLFRGEAVVDRGEVAEEGPAVAPVVEDVPLPPARPSWPPPADESSQWRELTPRGSRASVRARLVTLWGQQVWIDDADRAWCPACLQFKTTEELGRPGNSCPIGIVLPSGTIVPFEPGDDGPLPVRRDRFLDAVWRPW